MIEQDKHSFVASVIKCGIAGGCASIVTDTIYFPLDSIKTRLQASGKNVDYTAKANNVSKLKGLVPNLLASFPGAFGFFFSYEFTKKFATQKLKFEDGPYTHLIAAAAGETTSAMIRNPFEVIKQQMQIGLGKTTKETASFIFKAKGIRGFYAGMDSLILREIPFSCIQFPIYEYFKKRARKENKGGDLTYFQNAQNGAMSGSIAGFITTPVDVAKTKLMTQRDNYYKNLPDALVKIFKEEGPLKLFSAAHIRVFNLAFGGIVFFSAYEFFKKKFMTEITV